MQFPKTRLLKRTLCILGTEPEFCLLEFGGQDWTQWQGWNADTHRQQQPSSAGQQPWRDTGSRKSLQCIHDSLAETSCFLGSESLYVRNDGRAILEWAPIKPLPWFGKTTLAVAGRLWSRNGNRPWHLSVARIIQPGCMLWFLQSLNIILARCMKAYKLPHVQLNLVSYVHVNWIVY